MKAEQNLEFVQGSIEEIPEIKENIDYIIHCASPTASSFFIEYPVETIKTAVQGTINVLELAKEKKIKGMVYLSSMELYGKIEKDEFVSESELGYIDPLNIRSCYPESKRMCENLCACYAAEYEVPVYQVRLAQTFGPGISYEDKRVFAMMARKAIEGKDIILQTKGTSKHITTPIFTRILSTSEYGLISVYNSWFEIVRVFASVTLIFPGILNVGLYEHSDNRWKYLSSMLGMTACSTVVISVFYGIFHQSVNEFFKLPVSTIILMLITCFFQPATIFWTQKQRYEIKYKSTFCVSVGTAVMAQVVSVIAVLCLKNSNHNMGVVRLWSAGIVNLIVAIFLYIYICRRGKKYVDSILWKSTLFVAVPLIPHYLSTVVLSSIDKIMISQMISQNKTGIYSLAAILSAIGVLIWRALSVTYTPFVNSKLGERDFLSIREAVKPLLLVVAAFCILTALAAPEIIGILATKEYYEGIYVVPPIAAGIYTTALYDNFTAISFFHKKSFNIMIATVIAAISNVIMNYVFIMK